MKTLLISAMVCISSLLPLCAQEDKNLNGVIAEMEAKALYHPRTYESGVIDKFVSSGGKRLDYATSAGKQSAWLLAPAGSSAVDRLWLVCGGNAALALEMAPLCRTLTAKREAWLMVDYPGYGGCAGKPSPASIRENMKAAVTAALPLVKIDAAKLPDRLKVFGHSLGCAAALLATEEFHSKSAVLCAPFTSSKDMATEVLGLPASLPLTHLYDNRVGITGIAKNKGMVWILHGKADEIIPASMSERLAEEFKGTVNLEVIPGATHNDIFTTGATELQKAVEAARR